MPTMPAGSGYEALHTHNILWLHIKATHMKYGVRYSFLKYWY